MFQWAVEGQFFVATAVKLFQGKSGDSFFCEIMTTWRFYILILFNEKYTYLQIVDISSYGFKKYSTIEV